MSFQRFQALTELIKRYRRANDKDYYTIVICGFDVYSELKRRCVKIMFETREDKQEYFCGSRVVVTKDSNYLGVAYVDKLTGETSNISEITEEDFKI